MNFETTEQVMAPLNRLQREIDRLLNNIPLKQRIENPEIFGVYGDLELARMEIVKEIALMLRRSISSTISRIGSL